MNAITMSASTTEQRTRQSPSPHSSQLAGLLSGQLSGNLSGHLSSRQLPRPMQAIGLALVLELLVIAGVLGILLRQTPPPQHKDYGAMQLTLVEPEAPKTVVEELPKPPPLPEPLKKIEPTPPLPKPQPVAVAPTPKVVAEPLPVSAEPTTDQIAEAVPVVPESVIATPTPTAVNLAADEALLYNAQLTAAVQKAFVVPGSASALGFKGRTRIEFKLADGKVTAIRVIESSTLGAVDRAAMKAVENANYPPAPPSLQGKTGTYQIWVACL